MMTANLPQQCDSIAPVLVIPALDPDNKLPELIDLLRSDNPQRKRFSHIVVIDDGSDEAAQPVFTELARLSDVTVIHHQTNQGKGAALKTGFNWVLEHCAESNVGVVTADADGQHLAEDILAIASNLMTSTNRLWLGCREFQESKVPLRSKIGNICTLWLFRLFTGQYIRDTQTGLRGIPRSYLAKLKDFSSCGYEFELDMLLNAKRSGIAIATQSITTVYEDDNARSHYRPIIDSVKIYQRFFKFAGVGILSAGLDYGVFAAYFWLTEDLLWAIVCARVVSGIFNFSLNKQFVFSSKHKVMPELAKYVSLAGVLILANYVITESLTYLNVTPYIGKPIAELGIFLLSYGGQRRFVFKDS